MLMIKTFIISCVYEDEKSPSGIWMIKNSMFYYLVVHSLCSLFREGGEGFCVFVTVQTKEFLSC